MAYSGSAMSGGGFASVANSGISFHSGGMIRRAHSGMLASDEVPIIAQTGERILSRSQNAAYEKGMSKSDQPQQVIYQITAVDAQSFVQLCAKNPQGIHYAMQQAYRFQNPTARYMKGH